jgi:hypothetical protein
MQQVAPGFETPKAAALQIFVTLLVSGKHLLQMIFVTEDI